jgi:hypothetical protein
MVRAWGGFRDAAPKPKRDRGPANAHEAWLDFKEWHDYGVVPATGLDDLFHRVRQVLAARADDHDED